MLASKAWGLYVEIVGPSKETSFKRKLVSSF